MKQEVTQPKPPYTKPVYAKPTIEVLGSFASLTLGGKTHSMSDLHSGFGGSTHGPGS